MEITSIQNPKIKNILKLQKARERRRQKSFIVEGRHEIHLAEQGDWEVLEFYYCSDFSSDKNFSVQMAKAEKYQLSKNVFQKISSRENPDGYLAVFSIKKMELEKVELSDNPLLLVLVGLEKPGNIGAILRTADGAGVDAVIIVDSKVDVFNHNIIRASLGTFFTKQIALSSMGSCVDWLKKNKFQVIASTPRAKKIYTDEDFQTPSAIVIGPEHEGLSKEWLNQEIKQVKIPMQGKIDSLNASVSAAVLAYEAKRQRNFHH